MKYLVYTKCQINIHIFCLSVYPLEIIVTPLVPGQLTKIAYFQSPEYFMQRNIQQILAGVTASYPWSVLNWDEEVLGLSTGSSLDRQLQPGQFIFLCLSLYVNNMKIMILTKGDFFF